MRQIRIVKGTSEARAATDRVGWTGLYRLSNAA